MYVEKQSMLVKGGKAHVLLCEVLDLLQAKSAGSLKDSMKHVDLGRG